MVSGTSVTALVAALMMATSFEDAATATLQTMLNLIELRATAIPSAGVRLLRGFVHVRPDDGYKRLFGLEHRSAARMTGTGYLTSPGVWRGIFEQQCSVSIDVQRRTVRSWLRDGSAARRDVPPSSGLPSHATGERLLERDTTHVHVVPLRAPGGEVSGMITLEASNKSVSGPDPLWESCHEDLEVLASIAGPYLTALPLRPSPAARTDELLPVIGPSSAGMIELLRMFAEQEETILISGPTGAGKSRLARWCHAQSSHAEHPFETLDLLSMPEELQMAELFGWKRGAFTSAVKDNPGALARAGRGTLFIDEIDKLSLRAQAGFLRVLEERRFRPLGDDSGERRTEARFIVGTNADLRASVRAGRFREDLFYRINVLPMRLPALSQRLDELPMWAEYMLERRRRERGGGGASLAPEAMEALLRAQWPGNLRQLDNIVRRAYTLALAEGGRASATVMLTRRHVEQALAYDDSDAAPSLVASMWRLARAYVREAERRTDSDSPLTLDQCEALRGMVLGAALELTGDRDAAFVLLGQQHLLRGRNHHRALKRELERVREFVRIAGDRPEPSLASILAEADEPAGT